MAFDTYELFVDGVSAGWRATASYSGEVFSVDLPPLGSIDDSYTAVIEALMKEVYELRVQVWSLENAN